MLYSLSTCGHCRSAKNFLNANNISYDHVDVDLTSGPEREEVLNKVRMLNPNLSFPIMVIGDQVLVGFREAAVKEALGL